MYSALVNFDLGKMTWAARSRRAADSASALRRAILPNQPPMYLERLAGTQKFHYPAIYAHSFVFLP